METEDAYLKWSAMLEVVSKKGVVSRLLNKEEGIKGALDCFTLGGVFVFDFLPVVCLYISHNI